MDKDRILTIDEVFEEGKRAYHKLMDRPDVEPVDKELTKDYKPLYVDWAGDDNCMECFGEDCNTCAINLAHRYGTADCECNETLERFIKEEQGIIDIKYPNEELPCINKLKNIWSKFVSFVSRKNTHKDDIDKFNDHCLNCRSKFAENVII